MGVSVEDAAALLDMSPGGYTYCERWPTCLGIVDALDLAHAFSIDIGELTDELEAYVNELVRLGMV